MLAIEPHALRGAHLHVEARRRDLLDAGELFGEVREVGRGVDRLGLRAVAAIEVEHLLHDAIEAPDVALDDLDQAPLRFPDLRVLVEEIGRVPDRRERIADLVRDGGGEAPEGDQLHLLRLRAHAPDVLDEDHRGRRIAAADGDEMHLHLAREPSHAQLHERGLGAGAPFLQQRRDLGRVLRERRLARELADAALRVDHEDAVLHVANDELVDLREVVEVEAAFLGDLGAGARVARERRGERGGREERGAGDSRLHEVVRHRVQAPHLECLLEKHRERRDRRVEEREPAAGDERGRRERHEQQHGKAALHAAARVHEHDDRDHVDADPRRHLQRDAGLVQPRRGEQHQRDDRVDDERRHHRARGDDAEVEDAVEEREGDADEGREDHAIDAEDRERVPRGGVGLGERPRARRLRRIGHQHLFGGGAHFVPTQRGLSRHTWRPASRSASLRGRFTPQRAHDTMSSVTVERAVAASPFAWRRKNPRNSSQISAARNRRKRTRAIE